MANEKDPQGTRTRGPEHARLEAFVGEWQIRGENAPTAPGGAGSPVTGTDGYELLQGGFFVRGRWSHQFAEGEHVGTCVLGFDPETRAYFAHHYDNLGYARAYALAVDGATWAFTGPYERATWTFGADGRSYEVKWEWSKDGARWSPLCEMKGVRKG